MYNVGKVALFLYTYNHIMLPWRSCYGYNDIADSGTGRDPLSRIILDSQATHLSPWSLPVVTLNYPERVPHVVPPDVMQAPFP